MNIGLGRVRWYVSTYLEARVIRGEAVALLAGGGLLLPQLDVAPVQVLQVRL